MNVNSPENSPENNLSQVKVDENLPKNNVEINVQNNKKENKPEENTVEDENFKAFREGRKKDRIEKEAAEKRAAEKDEEARALKAAMEALIANSVPKSNQRTDNIYGMPGGYQQEETEDERIEKKVNAIISSREAANEKYRQEREKNEYPNRLMQTYPDFNQVISQENLDYLDYHHPELSKSLQKEPDSFEKWSLIYGSVKRYVPNNTTAKKEAAKAEANFNKPKSISSTGITQTQETRESMNSVEARRAARYEEMKRIMNKVS